MKKQLLVVLLGTALAAPMAAYAEGAYVGFNVGRTQQKASDGSESLKDNTTGYKLYGGFDFNKNSGVEAGYVDFGKAKAAYTDGAITGTFGAKPKALYVAATGTLPVNEQFSLFAKVGASINRTKISQEEGAQSASLSKNHTSVLLGIGAAYNFSKNLALVAEYEDFGKVFKEDGLDLKANLLSIGLRYKF